MPPLTRAAGRRHRSEEFRCGACLFKLPVNVHLLTTDAPFEAIFDTGYEECLRIPLDRLSLSVERGCASCLTIQQTLLRYDPQSENLFWERGGFFGDGEHDAIQFRFEESSTLRSQYPYDFHPFVDVGNYPTGDTSSSAAFQTLKEWIFRCCSEHSECEKSQSSKLPHRLLYVGLSKDSKVHLVDDTSTLGQIPYACLSHRWGGDTEASCLTQDRYSQYRDELPRRCLYPILFDTIEVVRRLELEYIWIDSLCIIQDDKKDWHRQALEMGSIYENAFLTISALSCNSSTGRLFSRSSIEATVDVPNTENRKVFLRKGITEHPFNCLDDELDEQTSFMDDFPLLKRGWVYQERFLSRRVIHYAKDELIWDCRQACWCECRSGEAGLENLRSQVLRDPTSYDWEQIVEAYSNMHLSFESDRLPALSGIASRFNSVHNMTHVAGLWIEALSTNIFWGRYKQDLCPRIPQLPSWSWTSGTGPVKFMGPKHCPDLNKTVELFNLVSHNISFSISNKFGMPEIGEITIDCPMVPAKLLYGEDWDNTLRQKYTNAFSRQGHKCDGGGFGLLVSNKLARFNPDYSLNEAGESFVPSGEEVFCMVCYGHENWDCGDYHVSAGLVVRRVHGERLLFQRIGCFGFWWEDPFFKMEFLQQLWANQIVTLI